MHLYEEHGPGLRRAAAGHVRDRDLGRATPPPGARPRPLRDQAARTTRHRRRRRSRSPPSCKALRRQPGLLRARSTRRARGLPGAELDSGAAHHLRGGAQAARRATCSICEDGSEPRWSATRGRPPSAADRGRAEPDGALAEELRERACATRCGAPGRRRAGRRAALRRRRLRALVALASEERLRAGAHLLDRLRGARRSTSWRARARSPSATGPTTTSSCSARRGRAPARTPRGGLRRALRRLVGAAHVPRQRARRIGGQGGAVGRGRRRALRWLLHLRRRPARAVAAPARGRCAAVR